MRKFVLLALALTFAIASNAQIGNFIKNKINQKVEQKIDNAIDKGIDNAEQAIMKDRESNPDKKNSKEDNDVQGGWTCPACGATGNTGNFCKECAAKKPSASAETTTNSSATSTGWTCPACGHSGNTGKFCNDCGAKKPEESAGSATWTCEKCGHSGNKGKFCDECGEAKGAVKVVNEYSKCDFVAGDEIFFEDNLAGEQLGEFPSKWDLLEGSGEVAKINGDLCINFPPKTDENAGNHSKIEPLMKNAPRYLPDVFTMEFDWYIFENNAGHLTGKNNEIEINFFNDHGESNRKPNETVIELILSQNNDNNNGTYSLHIQPTGETDWYQGRNSSGAYTIKIGAWNHFAISFNKRALKIYVNGTRIVNIPNCWAPQRFTMETSNRYIGNGNHVKEGTNIRNIRLAKGAVPLYDRLTTDGKIITYGITFDVGKSVIKDESYPEINRIANLMNEDPSLKFEVQGHTDNTGNAASNQTLSEARAKAIVDKLVEMGISADRLTSVGKGQTSPIADNSTDEGKAKNRRVEFVKK